MKKKKKKMGNDWVVYLRVYAGMKCDLRTKCRTRDRYEISSRTRFKYIHTIMLYYIIYNHVSTIYQNM